MRLRGFYILEYDEKLPLQKKWSELSKWKTPSPPKKWKMVLDDVLEKGEFKGREQRHVTD